MRYYIVVGEYSGDIHGADLIAQIKALDPNAQFWACGGTAMQKTMGYDCAVYFSTLAYMGFDFIPKIYKLWQVLKFCKKHLIAYQPHAVILIDSSGFNLQLATFAHQHGFKVFYYIPPKIWAHGLKRIKTIKTHVDQIFSILPFEPAYYQQHGYTAIDYVGNPLTTTLQHICPDAHFRAHHNLDQRPIVALFPGSRVHEIQRILPILTSLAESFSQFQFVVAGLNHIPKSLYQHTMPPTIPILYNQAYQLLSTAYLAIVTSGTASLEAALLNTPQIVVYKTTPLTYLYYKHKLAIKHLSLVNLLTKQCIVPELVQYNLTPKQLYHTFRRCLDPTSHKRQKWAYQQIKQRLGTQHAAKEVAQRIVNTLTS